MRIVLFGDSVFAGYGLGESKAPAARLAALLPGAEVVPAGIPDQTSADGLARAVGIAGDVVLVEFGLNDAISGMLRERVVANLRAIAKRVSGRVVMVEALVPAQSRWPAITDLMGVASEAADGRSWVPDILTGMSDAGLLQPDGLHPDATGALRIAERLAAALGLEKGNAR